VPVSQRYLAVYNVTYSQLGLISLTCTLKAKSVQQGDRAAANIDSVVVSAFVLDDANHLVPSLRNILENNICTQYYLLVLFIKCKYSGLFELTFLLLLSTWQIYFEGKAKIKKKK
jgi:hypothetical protein